MDVDFTNTVSMHVGTVFTIVYAIGGLLTKDDSKASRRIATAILFAVFNVATWLRMNVGGL